MGDRHVVSTSDAPAALGPYSQAVRAGGLVFLSGQIGLDPSTGKLIAGGVAEQTERVMLNLKAVAEAAGTDLAATVKTTCFLADMGDFSAFNEVYGRHFPVEPPARETVQVGRLPKDALVEVSAICVAPA